LDQDFFFIFGCGKSKKKICGLVKKDGIFHFCLKIKVIFALRLGFFIFCRLNLVSKNQMATTWRFFSRDISTSFFEVEISRLKKPTFPAFSGQKGKGSSLLRQFYF